MNQLLFLLGLTALLASCSSEPTSTKEECLAEGGTPVGNPGPIATCPDGKEQIGTYPEGVEGGICCK